MATKKETKKAAKELQDRIDKEGWTIGVHTNIIALLRMVSGL